MPVTLIEIDSGKLRGAVEDNINGATFVAFKGIPYAEPPIGDLRFRDPIPVRPWTGIRDATKFGEPCFQYNAIADEFIGSEDCLYLNVFTPTLFSPSPRSVMVCIHGGRFTYGCGNDDVFGVDHLIERDVVVVTLNFRLGCLGFLNLEDKAAAGNQGLKDQILALRWVQRNIRKFTGDPHNVTVFGHSSGGGCAHYLALSPMGRGLFHKLILQSGVIVVAFSLTPPVVRNRRLGTLLGRAPSDAKDFVEYLRTVEVQKLIEAQERVLNPEERDICECVFLPGPDAVSDNPVFPEALHEAIKFGIQMPCIIGHVSDEGLFIKGHELSDASLKAATRIAEKIIRTFPYYEKWSIPINTVIKHYLGEDEHDEMIVPKLATCMTDVNFIGSTHAILDNQKKVSNAPTYYYNFAFYSDKTLIRLNRRIDQPGACHGDDLSFLFRHRLMDKLGKNQFDFNGIEHRVLKRMTEMWTNFAKTGKPTPTTSELIPVMWEPIDKTASNDYKCLRISESLTMETVEDHYQHWIRKIQMA